LKPNQATRFAALRREGPKGIGYMPHCVGNLIVLDWRLWMAFVEGLIGENHSGTATVIGIVGIDLIGTSGAIHAANAARAKTEN
jgi:hypothetical protein